MGANCVLVLYVQARWESCDHLLLHCQMARELWSFPLCLFEVQWVMPKRVVDMLACWKGQHARNGIGVVRIARTFKGSEHSRVDMKLMFLRTLFGWMTSLHGNSASSLLNFIDSCTFLVP